MTDGAGSPAQAPPAVDVAAYVDGVLSGSRAGVARAITLVESRRADHRIAAQQMLQGLMPHTGEPRRVGVSGVPGVGKSTFIDALGIHLIERGHRVAVLAVDPSSTRTGGSILGDKTRMTRLAANPDAFVRPSPTSGTLGGVARATREAMIVMAAAGYDVLLIETVGVGQSETTVAEMTDSFLLLALARTGDQLQGIKKGIVELADVVAVNKADGPHEQDARRAARELAGALRLLGARENGWRTPVLTCSAMTGAGLNEVWDRLAEHERFLRSSGQLAHRQEQQRVSWMWALVRDELDARLRDDPSVPRLESAVRAGELTPVQAAHQLLEPWRPSSQRRS